MSGTSLYFPSDSFSSSRIVYSKAMSESEELRDEGIQRVLDHNAAWLLVCKSAADMFLVLCGKDHEFIGEDIRAYCADYAGEPSHPNAWGGLSSSLTKSKQIVHTGAWRQMKKPSSHARLTKVYKRGDMYNGKDTSQ